LQGDARRDANPVGTCSKLSLILSHSLALIFWRPGIWNEALCGRFAAKVLAGSVGSLAWTTNLEWGGLRLFETAGSRTGGVQEKWEL